MKGMCSLMVLPIGSCQIRPLAHLGQNCQLKHELLLVSLIIFHLRTFNCRLRGTKPKIFYMLGIWPCHWAIVLPCAQPAHPQVPYPWEPGGFGKSPSIKVREMATNCTCKHVSANLSWLDFFASPFNEWLGGGGWEKKPSTSSILQLAHALWLVCMQLDSPVDLTAFLTLLKRAKNQWPAFRGSHSLPVDVDGCAPSSLPLVMFLAGCSNGLGPTTSSPTTSNSTSFSSSSLIMQQTLKCRYTTQTQPTKFRDLDNLAYSP